ncbi:MAG: carbon-nitrogen hydrolase family protein [Thalassobaculum sp.]|uniref:carbon-nitrogen hydrolase family protein n=1 Tax=Thalassobaculum sp. TaxID=2022740 RepID=UPI0032EE6838
MAGPAVTVATVQCPVTGSPAHNAAAIVRAMRRAAARGARVVHCTEGALSGYTREQIPSWDAVDFAAVRAGLERIAAEARRLGVWAVVGSAHALTPPNRPHNALYVVSDRGEIAGRYDKRRCSNNEINNWYSPGFEPCVFAVDGIRFGCALCIEVNFPELFVEAAGLGVDVMLLSAYSRDPIYGVLAQAHAAANNLWVSYSVPVDASPAYASRMFGPDGSEVARCRRRRDQVLVTPVVPGDPAWEIPLRRARPWRALARAGGIYEARRVDDPRSRALEPLARRLPSGTGSDVRTKGRPG